MKQKSYLIALSLLVLIMTQSFNHKNDAPLLALNSTKYNIKIKNDSNDEHTVYNAGSGGTYRLQKNVTTTIKMEGGEKLYDYEGGKKGKLLLTADEAMDGKIQLFSKLK